MTNPNLQALHALALQTKSAAVNTSGQQVLPYAIYPNAGAGMYDPSDANARYSMLANNRVAATYQGVLGAETNPMASGVNLGDYAGVLNQGYNSINWLTTKATSPMGKAASLITEQGADPQLVDPQLMLAIAQEVANYPSPEAMETGYFDETTVPTVGEWAQMEEYAEKSAAADLESLVVEMFNNGVFEDPAISGNNPYFGSAIEGIYEGYL
jgi:hypothetical protein